MSERNSTVAVALIVKNEAHNIDLCLQSVCNWVDEIVVLDAGSSDNTTEIAKQYTDKVYVASDWRGFGKQRQRAQSYVESGFVFWLDADERVTPELKKNILGVINDHQPNCVYYINSFLTPLGKKSSTLVGTQIGFADFIKHQKLIILTLSCMNMLLFLIHIRKFI